MGERSHRMLEAAEEDARLAVVEASVLLETWVATPKAVADALLKCEQTHLRALVLRRIADRD